jgi:hypothetical protein
VKPREEEAREERNMDDQLKLDVINLKYIGAALDRTVQDLELIRETAKNKEEVTGVIGELKAIESKVAGMCKTNWFRKFEI